MARGSIALVLALVMAQPAQAATVELRDAGGGQYIRYVAGPGERNNLTFEEIEDAWPTAVLVRDTGAVIAVGNGCVSVDAHRAMCIAASGAMYHERVQLGDGDDVLNPAGFTLMTANGGPGDDVLLGGTWDDRLNGGGGRDELRGNEGSDELTDGDSDAAHDADVLDGGPDRDSVSYEERAEGVVVDLADPAPAGAPGEGDVLTGIENVHGGRGDDVLSGTDRANIIRDEGGRNDIHARGGRDEIRSAAGTVDCGLGRDDVRGVTARTFLAASCERVIRFQFESTFWSDAHPRATADGLAFRIYCTEYYDGIEQDCSGAATVREAAGRKRLLAVARIAPGSYLRRVRLKLTPLGARLLARRDRVVTMRLRGDVIPSLSWRVLMKRRRS